MKYRKKPIAIIEAEQWFPGKQVEGVQELVFDSGAGTESTSKGTINTPEGPLMVSPGDWVITGIDGEFYLCKPDIFEATYELVQCLPPSKKEHDRGRWENQAKILSDQLEIEQASKRTCPSCGLLWPNHDDNCGLWINVEALVRIRAEIEAEVTTRERRRCAERTPSKSCNCERCTGIKIDGYYQYESSDDEGEKP